LGWKATRVAIRMICTEKGGGNLQSVRCDVNRSKKDRSKRRKKLRLYRDLGGNLNGAISLKGGNKTEKPQSGGGQRQVYNKGEGEREDHNFGGKGRESKRVLKT